MTKLPTSALILVCGGVLLTLGGCSHPAASGNGVPFPAPQAAASAQVQIKNVENDPHIPAAAKPGIEAGITRNNTPAAGKAPATGP